MTAKIGIIVPVYNTAGYLSDCLDSLCQQTLKEKLGCVVRHFAYPWGQHDRRTQRVLAEDGRFDSVATIHRGAMEYGHNPLALRRDRADLNKSPRELELLMRLSDRLYCLRKINAMRRRFEKCDHRELIGCE